MAGQPWWVGTVHCCVQRYVVTLSGHDSDQCDPLFYAYVCPINNQRHCCVLYRHTHPFNGPFSVTTRVSRYQKCNTNLDFTEARDSEWQWHQLGYVQVCTSLHTDNHANTPPLSFLQAGCPSCCPTNSIKALCLIQNV